MSVVSEHAEHAQPAEHAEHAEHADLLAKLERHFMSPIALVSWDQEGQFRCYGAPCSEEDASSDDLIWRRLDLPAEPEIPF